MPATPRSAVPYRKVFSMRLQPVIFIIIALFCCTPMQHENSITILDRMPLDSSDVHKDDTITATIDYTFDEKYQAAGVILALELLCTANSVGDIIIIDTLYNRSAVIDAAFRLADFDTLCDYELRPKLHVMRFKLVLGGGSGGYSRVVRSEELHYFY